MLALVTGVGKAALFRESMTQAFAAISKGASDGTGEMKKMRALAMEFGADFQETATNMRDLMSKGFKMNEAESLFKSMQDLRGFGRSADEISRALLAITQIKAAGRLQGDELNQLAEAGLAVGDVYKELSKITGKSVTEVMKLKEAGKIDAGLAIKAIQAAIASSTGAKNAGDFGKKIANETIGGMLNRIKNMGGLVLDEIAEKLGPALKEIKPILDDVMKAIQGPEAKATDRGHRRWLPLRALERSRGVAGRERVRRRPGRRPGATQGRARWRPVRRGPRARGHGREPQGRGLRRAPVRSGPRARDRRRGHDGSRARWRALRARRRARVHLQGRSRHRPRHRRDRAVGRRPSGQAQRRRWRAVERGRGPGLEHRRRRRYLEARERKLGKPGAILLATGARGRSHVRVTLHAIRTHCPELFPGKAEQLERDFTRYMRAMGTRVRELVVEAFAEEVGEHVEPRLVSLERAVRALQQAKDSTRLGGG